VRAVVALWALAMTSWAAWALLKAYVPVWAAQRRLELDIARDLARIELERRRRDDQPVHKAGTQDRP
jgi:hypothetical protein